MSYAVPCAVPPCRNTTKDPSGFCHAHAGVARGGRNPMVPLGFVPPPTLPGMRPRSPYDYDPEHGAMTRDLAQAINDRPEIRKALYAELKPRFVATIRENPDSLRRVLGALSQVGDSLPEDDRRHLEAIGVFSE